MMPLEVNLAIYKRLTGAPLDGSGRPMTDGSGVPLNRERIGPPDLNLNERIFDPETGEYTEVLPTLPSYGIRVPMTLQNSRQGLTSYNQDALPLFSKFDPKAMTQVPVFDQNMSGRKFDDIWPCVTFKWMGMDFDAKTFVYHDPFGAPDTDSELVNIRNRNGDIIQTGYARNLVRPHPESWPMTYTITAHAKSELEIAMICAEIARLFPARGALNVEFANGEVHACDMLLLRTATMDPGGDEAVMTRHPAEQREFSRAFVYVVESYLDNTVNKYGISDTRSVAAITQRILDLDAIMGDMIVRKSTDEELNLGELKPITT